jgi:predicted nuclease with TOPRIM domain
VRIEEYIYLQESVQNNQKNLHELKELLTGMRKTLRDKENELERLSSKENEFVEQIKTLNKENVCLKEKITQKNEEVNKLRQEELFKVKAQEDSFSDVELVKYKEVSHLAPIIQF